jgi:hypothetical protein
MAVAVVDMQWLRAGVTEAGALMAVGTGAIAAAMADMATAMGGWASGWVLVMATDTDMDMDTDIRTMEVITDPPIIRRLHTIHTRTRMAAIMGFPRREWSSVGGDGSVKSSA